MGFTRQKFGLFFSLPLSSQDWANLAVSRVKLVQLPLEFADGLALRRLAGMGVRALLRINEDAYYSDDAVGRLTARVLMAREVCPLEGVVVGNEPENAQDLTYTSASFGQPFAYVHRARFDAVRVALQSAGVKVISPAQTMRSISEDEQPIPGSVTWREICTLPETRYTEAQGQYGYLSANGNGGHIYCYGWDGPTDELRFKFALKYLANIWHKPIYIDEIGIAGNHTQLEKMAGYVSIAEILLSQRNGKQHPLGQRTEALIPFVSNGVPNGQWDARYLLTDPACYQLLGNWLSR